MQEETDQYDEEYIKRYTSRPWYRKKILRKIELFPALFFTKGKTIDFGCGTGDLLESLPKGSVGLDINPHAINYCLEQNLDAVLYDAYFDNFNLSPLQGRNVTFESLAMCHLLEHLPNAAELMPKLFRAAKDLGVSRIVITVPGQKGYNRDETHRTFVNPKYIIENQLETCAGFILKKQLFHPIPTEAGGRHLAENTYVMVYTTPTT